MAAFTPPLLRGPACRLLVVFGDQLDIECAALKGLDRKRDAIVMMEVGDEARLGPSHKQRTALFLSAMRHFAAELVENGYRLEYVTLDHAQNTGSFASEITRVGRDLKAEALIATRPGDWRTLDAFQAAGAELGIPAELVEDAHFLTDLDDFARWASERTRPVMEFFYRDQRKRLDVLMESGQPTGGAWNFDKENRKSFKRAPTIRQPYSPRVDAITKEVCELVLQRFSELPGQLSPHSFRWCVTRSTARRALDDFIKHRLPHFGAYEDAMWSGEPFLHHSLLSVPLNLKLLDPRECVDRAVAAYEAGQAPLNSVEGFVRQIIGWREFIRGIYWTQGREYRQRNGLEQHGALPEFYWSGETDLECLRQCLHPVLEHGYSHHIPRLMVLANFALISGVHPRAIGDWFYGMYVDSVDWVTTPNTIGMAMHADHGVVGTKPYAGSGKYISRMSNYCENCSFDVKSRSDAESCPFNVFYWDFLRRNRERFASNHRMTMMLKNSDRIDGSEAKRIAQQADRLREELGIGEWRPQ